MSKPQRRASSHVTRRAAPPPPPRRKFPVIPAAIGGIVLLAVVAFVVVQLQGGDEGASPGQTQPVTVTGQSLPRLSATDDAALGRPAPEFSGRNFIGDPVEIRNDGRGKVLVFMAHWCPHCQAEVPRLVAVGQGGKIEGVEVTAVATGTSPDQPNYPPSEWLAREDWPYGVVLDDEQGTAGNAFGLSAYPFLVFVDADGNVAGRTSGEISEEDLTAIFSALAKGDPLPIPGAGAGTQR